MKVKELRQFLSSLRNVADDAEVMFMSKACKLGPVENATESAIFRGENTEFVAPSEEQGDEERIVLLWEIYEDCGGLGCGRCERCYEVMLDQQQRDIEQEASRQQYETLFLETYPDGMK